MKSILVVYRKRTTDIEAQTARLRALENDMNKRALIFILFTAAFLLSYFFRTANAVIARDLSSDLSLSPVQLGFMTSLFYITFAILQIPLGVALDRWGPRRVTSSLFLVGAVGSFVFSQAQSFAILAFGRALIGVGMSCVLIGGFKSFSQWYPPKVFATVSGLFVGLGSLGSLAAATPLAWLTQNYGWRSVFAYGSILLVLVAAAMMAWVCNKPVENAPVNRSLNEDMRRVFMDLRFWRIVPLVFFLSGTLQAVHSLWAGPYLFDVTQLDQLRAGNVLIWMSIGLSGGFLTSGWLSDRLGIIPMIFGASSLFLLAQIALIIQPDIYLLPVVYFIFGYAGAFNIMLLVQARHIFSSEIAGQAVSAVNFFAIGGVFIIQSTMGLIINSFVGLSGSTPPNAYTAAFLFTAFGLAISLLWYLPLLQFRKTVFT